MPRIQTAEHWAASRVEGFPQRWRKRLLSDWEQGRATNERNANIQLREVTDSLSKVRLSLDASDSEICTRAEEFAAQAMDMGRIHTQIEFVRKGMEIFVESCGLVPPDSETVEHKGAIGRMTCRDWWRRGLRKLHAVAVEGAAIRLGYVNKARDLYVSDESLARRQQQIRRNALMMENTVLRNENEQEFTLAELAAKGTANKAIRRGELMTRIAGFEVIALECGHGGLFLTVTCPSRMHKWNRGANGKVYQNEKYDGTTPKQAQAYLAASFTRIRSSLKRKKLGIYGFRIAEPHHDACPHWHLLCFHEKDQGEAITAVFKKYALQDSPDEAGAQVHRVKAEAIDWKKGTAAGYIAKYVAKNIDGLHVENDLYGNPAMETSQRVEAWASTWGIRQFQQIGGAPVGVWRELRRVAAVPDGAPEHLKTAHAAVNRIEQADGEVKAASYAEYTKAQGGVFVGRGAVIQLAKESTGEFGKYGEVKAAVPVGVATTGGEHYRDGIVHDRFRLVEWVVRSVRHVWEVVRSVFKQAGEFSRPWTGVNNCTRGKAAKNEKNGFMVFDRGGGDDCFSPPSLYFAEMA